jgi:hypothetical protein
MRARDHFDLVSLLAYLDPGEDEWDTIYAAAVSHTAYDTTRGAKSPFPSPIDFIDAHYGYSDEDEPVWSDLYTRNRSLLTARIVNRLIEDVKLLNVNYYKTVTCPICKENVIEVGVGNPLVWNKLEEDVALDVDNERAVNINIKCDCKGFSPVDFLLIEKQL